MTPTIRRETEADREAVRRVHRLAFGQDDEANLVDALRAGGYARVSLVAETDGQVVGHILFSDLPILTDAGTVPAVSLAPMAVLPEHQRRGVGSALVRRGMEVCRDHGHRVCVVVGHPAYYPRYGFSAKLAEPLASPFDAGEAWMAAELAAGALDGVAGWVGYPPPFGIGPYVRPAYPPDRAEWLRMRAALWPEETPGEYDDEVTTYFGTRSFRWAGSVLPAAVFVAVRPGGGLCGFVEATVRPFAEGCDSGPVGYVEGWYVDPDVRRRGVGRLLVAAAGQWAVARGCTAMASDARLDNAVSRDAHKALGFEEVERLVHFRKRLTGRSCGEGHPAARRSDREDDG
jgi:putative acetyltransferase